MLVALYLLANIVMLVTSGVTCCLMEWPVNCEQLSLCRKDAKAL